MNRRKASAALATLAGVSLVLSSGVPAFAKAKTITLTELDYFGTNNPPIVSAIKEFEATHPNIKIVRQTVPYAQLLPKALQDALTHSLPDILQLDNPWLQDFSTTGALVPLSKFGHVRTSDYFQSSLSSVTYKGQIYGFPWGNNTVALFYNKKMFAAAHITSPPKTWAELRADAKKLTHGDVYGFAFTADPNENTPFAFQPFLLTNGGSMTHLDSPQSIAALQLWVNMVKDGSVSKSVLNWAYSDVANQLIQGRVAMTEDGQWDAPTYAAAKNLDFGIAQMPTPKAGMNPIETIGGEVWSIPVSTPEKEKAAYTFEKWLTQPNRLLGLDKTLDYIPPYKSTAKTLIKQEPNQKVFMRNMLTARARTEDLGTNYPKVAEALWTAIQAAISGAQTPTQALQRAQQTVNQVTGH